MFDGYYGRRRLKKLFISFIISLVLIIIIYRHQDVFIFRKLLSLFGFNHLNIRKHADDEITSHLDGQSKAKILLPRSRSEGQQSNKFLSSFKFLNSPFLELLDNSTITIPILVLSKASNIDIRDAVRRTWGYDRLYGNDTVQYKIFFLVGIDDYMTKRIHTEQILFDDVIQVSLPDVYSFFAHKELSAMIWVRTYLPNAPFYIKTDDEVIMNMNVVVNRLLPAMEPYMKKSLIIGWFGREHAVERGNYQKFINAVIPPASVDLYYAMSLLYIITSEASDYMLDAITDVENIQHPGDPFVTGVLREAARVEMKNLATSTEYFKYEVGNGACKDAFERDPKLLLCSTSASSSTRFTSSRSVSEYFEVWDLLLSQNGATDKIRENIL